MTVPTTTPAPERGGLSPRQRRQVSLTVQYVIFVIAVVLIALAVDWQNFATNFLSPDIAGQMLPQVFTVALKNTVIYTVLAYVWALPFGLVLAIMRLSPVAPYRWVSTVYIEVFRGLPVLLIIMLISFGLPMAIPGLQLPGGSYGIGALGLGLAAAAYMAETFRAGIQAVPKGQVEAARSLGMSQGRATFSIVVPQAFRIVIPPLTNELVLLFKDSSLVAAAGVTSEAVELTKYGSDMAIELVSPTTFMVAGLSYLIITVPLGITVRRLEARQARTR